MNKYFKNLYKKYHENLDFYFPIINHSVLTKHNIYLQNNNKLIFGKFIIGNFVIKILTKDRVTKKFFTIAP